MSLPPLRLLVAELELATRPIVDADGWITGWPVVSHPQIVRAWLGDHAVVSADDTRYQASDVGTLSDPEAAGWAIEAARALEAGRELAMPDDPRCARYAMIVMEGDHDD